MIDGTCEPCEDGLLASPGAGYRTCMVPPVCTETQEMNELLECVEKAAKVENCAEGQDGPPLVVEGLPDAPTCLECAEGFSLTPDKK